MAYAPKRSAFRQPGHMPNQDRSADFGSMKSPALDLLSLRADVGRKGKNRWPDVARLESLLGSTGYLDLAQTGGPTGYFGERLDQAIRNFQKDQGVRVDGRAKPDGETFRSLIQESGLDKADDSSGPPPTIGINPIGGDGDWGDDPDPGWMQSLFSWITGLIHRQPEPGDNMIGITYGGIRG